MKLPDFRAVIFDCDGTLALTADLHFDAFNAALARQGARISRDWYDARKGLDRNGLIAAVAAAHSSALDTARLAADSLGFTISRAETTARENPPVAALARRLHGETPIAIGSNAETDVVRAILRGAGLDHLFDVVVTVIEAGRAKPDPAIFVCAAEKLGIAAQNCLVIEDSDEGVLAAERAGMQVWDIRRMGVLDNLAKLPG